ncbi:hypothetical protein PLESTB_001797200 [Pleodorina starrii]|uniref:Nucleolar protein 16 n=1 Tax=Pleodorina starrii TaxID=330485 RepID=A0A9W6C1I5_9CHLO|nr:hypothetical protein PLESTM_001161600 [Pleodorina starrii]GLC61735.1 hypothetical protein PLESTB_001797200 [Pleodorina starrii]GLC69215.1 hypothetical protein PLESTF_000802900 [Pleodorina starrii]
MGGSRRRLKKNAPKVRNGLVKRKKDEKTKLPLEIAFDDPALVKRLKKKPEWDEKDTLGENYSRNQLVADPNILLGRKEKKTPLVPPEVRKEAGEETFSDDDEQRAALNMPRKSGKAPPPRLTSTQRKVVGALLEKHGDDVHAMMLDTKLNKMQHSEGELRKLIEAYRFWGPTCSAAQKHDFWTDKKPPKKLLNCRILV